MVNYEDMLSNLPQEKLLKIGELAKESHVGVPTIRYYESIGLLDTPTRSSSGYRYYERSTIERIKFIKKAQFLQFSLEEIKQIIGIHREGNLPCPMVQKILDQKIQDLQEKIQQATTLKAELEYYRDAWSKKEHSAVNAQEVCPLVSQVNIAVING